MWVIPRSDYSFFNDTIIDILLIAVGLLPLRLEKIEKPKKKGEKKWKEKIQATNMWKCISQESKK